MSKPYFVFITFFYTLLTLAGPACAASDASSADPGTDGRRDLAMPDGLPDSWQPRFIKEPVFGSQMLTIEAGADNDQTIIMVHGLGQDGYKVWTDLIGVLENDYHILTFDLPGFGYSETPAGKYSPANYGRLLHWLDERYSKNKAIVIGHSMGGGVTLHYAAQYPDRIAKVILVDAAGILEKTAFVKGSARLPIDTDVLPGFLNQWVNQINNLVAQAIEWANVNPDPIEMLRMTDMGWKALLSDRPNTNAALGLITHDFSKDIDGFPHETVLIWGGNDSIAPLRIAHLLNGRLPKSRLHVIAEAAHVPMRSHTLRFNKLLEQALHSSFDAEDTLPALTSSDSVLRCDNESGTRYSGHYKRIEMNRCLGVVLNDVSARSITLTDTIVTMNNVHIRSGGTAVSAVNSGITATNARISGAVAVEMDASRLDLAGVTLNGKQAALRVKGESFLIASVSDVTVNARRCFIHGTYRMTDQTLESMLPDECNAHGIITFRSPRSQWFPPLRRPDGTTTLPGYEITATAYTRH